MPDNEQSKADQSAETKTMDADTARRVEREKLTRRAALRKLGFGAGIAALSMFSVDDLARLVGQRMERMAGDNKVAQAIAKEFQQAGIAFAGSLVCDANGCSDDQLKFNCTGCPTTTGGTPTVTIEGGNCHQCVISACGRCFGTNSEGVLSQAGLDCQNRLDDACSGGGVASS